jgi:hypothetical protein
MPILYKMAMSGGASEIKPEINSRASVVHLVLETSGDLRGRPALAPFARAVCAGTAVGGA